MSRRAWRSLLSQSNAVVGAVAERQLLANEGSRMEREFDISCGVDVGKWSHHFTYENGLIVSFLNIHQGDTAIWGSASYNTDGLVEEILCHAGAKTTKWHLTWVDGDATQVVEEILAPEDMVGTHNYTYEYDDRPCVYTGFPMAYSIFDGDGVRVATRQSKHNRIREGYTYYYDLDNGLLISAAAENDSVSYHYIDLMME